MNQEIKNIKRVDALREMEIKEDGRGEAVYYSIRFLTKQGESIYLPKARTCGLKGNMKKIRARGVMPVDNAGNAIGHPYKVSIDNIMMLNGQNVVL